MRAIRCAVAAVLVAGIVAVVGAQPPRQPGGGFGFGGGDLTSLVLNNEALQTELKVTAEQKEKFKPLTEKQAELDKSRPGFGKNADKDKAAEYREKSQKLREEIKTTVDGTLTADQKKRMKQISIQMMGLTVFSEPVEGKGGFGGTSESQKALMKEVADAMKFTDAQKTKVKEVVDDYNKDRDAIRKDVFGDTKGGGFGKQDPEKTKDFTAKSGKLREATWEKVTAALDDTQKKTWKDLTGEPFDTTKLFQPRVQPKKD